MFCAQCGAETSGKDKFCPKCGHSITGLSTSDEKEKNVDKQVATANQTAPKNTGCLPCLYIFYVIFSIFFFIGILSYASSAKGNTTNLVVGASIFSFTFVILGIWGLIGLGRRNRQNQTQATETATPIPSEKKKRNWWPVLAILLVIFTFLAFGYPSSIASKTGEIVWVVLLVVSVILFFLSIRQTIIKLINAFRKRPWRTGIITGLIIAIIVVPVLLILSYLGSHAADNFIVFQNSFADVLSTKYLGDDILAGKSSADFGDVKKITQAALDNMNKEKGSGNDKYFAAMIDWADKINTAAKSKKTWKNLPDLPSGIGEVLSSKTAENYYQLSLNRTVLFKDYGDWAIAKGDKETMRQIAAELEVEAIWQNNLSDQLTLNFISQAYASTNSVKTPRASLPRGGCKGVVGCRKKTGPSIHNLSQAARNYSVGTPDAAKEWGDGWNNLLNTIKIDNGYNLEGMGVIKDGKTTTQTSPMEQAFNEECKAKGGTTGGTGGVKDRLPMTLSAGSLNCDYKDSGRACWDTMTPTGQRFMGGENGCPEENLLPKPAPAPTNNGGNNNKTTWNGTYNVTYSSAHCNLATSIGYSSIFDVAGLSDKIVVSGNRVQNADGSTSAISSSGKANFSWSYNYAGTGTVKLTQTFNFSGNSVSGQVSFSANAFAEGGTGTVTCSESFSGSK